MDCFCTMFRNRQIFFCFVCHGSSLPNSSFFCRSHIECHFPFDGSSRTKRDEVSAPESGFLCTSSVVRYKLCRIRNIFVLSAHTVHESDVHLNYLPIVTVVVILFPLLLLSSLLYLFEATARVQSSSFLCH